MIQKGFGEDPKAWPNCGCRARFRPWRNGPSKVVEFKVDETWYRFLAERLPQVLDDEIKAHLEAFTRAQGLVTAEEIRKSLQISFPQTNPVDRDALPGVCNIIMVAHITKEGLSAAATLSPSPSPPNMLWFTNRRFS